MTVHKSSFIRFRTVGYVSLAIFAASQFSVIASAQDKTLQSQQSPGATRGFEADTAGRLSGVYNRVDLVSFSTGSPSGPFFLMGDFSRKEASKTTARLAQLSDGQAVAREFLANEAELLGIANTTEHQLRYIGGEIASDGRVHAFYKDHIAGLRVDGSDIRVHMESDGTIFTVNGNLVPVAPSVEALIIAAAKAALFSEDQVRTVIETDLIESGPVAVRLEKVCKPAPPYVVWKVDAVLRNTLGRWLYEIDAASGVVLTKKNGLQQDTAGSKIGTGTGVTGDAQNHIDSYFDDGILGFFQKYILRDETRRANNNIHGHNGQMASNGIIETDVWGLILNSIVQDDDNAWNSGGAQAAGVDAHVFAAEVYDYYLAHGFNSFDRNGSSMFSLVEVNTSSATNNAYWDGQRINFGVGSGQLSFAGALDVAGHEWSHAVTQYASALTYEAESGALNEAFSDWMGTAIEFYYGGGNWTMGEKIHTVRDLANPMNYYQPDVYGGTYWYPTDVSCTDSNDHCGVHTNSGVGNKMFYLLSQGGLHKYNITVTGLGIETAAKIALDANRLYWIANSDYAYARTGMLAAAVSYGQNAVAQVKNAWAAVGVGAPANPQPATMTSPANGSSLTGTSVTFVWTVGVGVTEYTLYVGSAPGGNDLYGAVQGLNTSKLVTGLPADGRTVYVRLWSKIGGNLQFADYTYTAFSNVTPVPATMTSPLNNSTLSGSSATFHWTTGAGVQQYFLYIGNSLGLNDIYGQSQNLNTSVTVNGLPTDGRKLYVRLWSLIGANWLFNDYTYFAYSSVTPTPATMTSPLNNSTLAGSSVTFQWNTGVGVQQYFLYIGNSPGLNDIYGQSQNLSTSVTVNGLPTDGRKLYVRLWSLIGGSWLFNDYTYFAFSNGTPTPAAMTSPPNNSTLSGSSATFQWSTGVGVQQYFLYIGNSPGLNDIYGQSQNLSTSVTVNGLPTDGRKLYVRLWSLIGGNWLFNDYTYFAFFNGTQTPATMTSPPNNSTLTGSSATFQWSTGVGVQQYFLYIGNSPGLNDIYGQSQNLSTSVTVNGLPTDGRKLYVRLWSLIGANWLFNDYTYYASSGGTAVDLIVTSVTFPTNVTQGAQATFSATVKNQGTAAAGAFRMSFYLSTDATITTSDNNIGNCTWTSLTAGSSITCSGPLTVSLSPGTYYGGAIVDDLSQVQESNESNNVLNASNTTVVSAASTVDLIVTSVTFPTNVTQGAQATFSATVKNQGTAAAGAFRMSFYLSTDATITTSDNNIGNCTWTSLTAGSSITCSGPLTVSLSPGTYYGGAIVDDLSQVQESNESNNVLNASNTTVVSAASTVDLIVTSVTFPTNVTQGAQATFSATVKNQGTAAVGAFRMSFYLSTDATITTSDNNIGYCTWTSLTAGSSITCSGPLTVSLSPGTYYGGAIVDDLSQVQESNESNNVLNASNTTVVSAASTVDLIVTSVTFPTNVTQGAQATFSATVKNQGTAAAGAFRMSFYLSTDATITTSDNNIGNCTWTSLTAGSSITCSGPLTVSLSPGTYYGGAIVDDLSQVQESNESNNVLNASNTTVVSAASTVDLIVTSVTFPTNVTQGAQATFSATVKNQGTAAVGAFRMSFYLSTDATITTSDNNIGYCNWTSLAAGTSITCSGPLTVSLSPGTYYGGAIVDDLSQVQESNESNNVLNASNTTVVSAVSTVDLIVTSVTFPSSVSHGAQATFSATVKNQGTAAAGAFRMSFYLSTDSTITTSDYNIGYCSWTSLAAGASITCSGPLTVNVGVGTYYGGAIADDLSQVQESNENNNVLAASNTTRVL